MTRDIVFKPENYRREMNALFFKICYWTHRKCFISHALSFRIHVHTPIAFSFILLWQVRNIYALHGVKEKKKVIHLTLSQISHALSQKDLFQHYIWFKTLHFKWLNIWLMTFPFISISFLIVRTIQLQAW